MSTKLTLAQKIFLLIVLDAEEILSTVIVLDVEYIYPIVLDIKDVLLIVFGVEDVLLIVRDIPPKSLTQKIFILIVLDVEDIPPNYP